MTKKKAFHNSAIRRLRAAGFIGFAAAIATPSVLGNLYVGTGKTVRHSVEGNVTQADNVVVAPRGTLVKTGEGTWTLPTSKIMQGWDANLAVDKGTLKIRPDAAPSVTGFETPPAVMQNAAVWFDTQKADSFVRDGSDNITDWLDRRETGNANDGYLYTRAHTDNTVTNLYPELKAKDGTTGLYFQGYSSGCWMNLLTPANAQGSIDSYNVFAVQGQFAKYGALFGCRKSLSTNPAVKLAFVPGNASGAFNPFWTYYCHDIPAMHAARTYIDGGEVDAFTTEKQYFPNNRFALLEVEFCDKPGAFQCFFNDRDYWGSRNISGMNYNQYAGDRIGGEYICEVVAFTNALTAAERLQVEGYLMAKWFGVKRPSELSVTVGADAQVAIESAGADAEKIGLSFGGGGELEMLDGDGVDLGLLSLLPGFSGHFRFAGSSLCLRNSMPFALNGGEQLDVSLPYDGPTIVRTTADAGKFVKSGAGTLRADSLPSSVKRLDVLGGEMVLEAPRTASTAYASPDSVVTGYVPNASFENGVGATTETINLGTTTGFQGWTAVAGAGANLANLAWVNHSTYKGGKNNSSQYWKLPTDVPDGESVLAINQAASVWTTITLPQEGVYELTFMGSVRQGKTGLILELAVGADAENLQTFGYFRAPGGWPKYYPYSFRLPRLAAGSYQLWFKQVDASQDRCSLIDDLKLTRIPDAELAYDVPNGSFEHFKGTYADLPEPEKFKSTNFDALSDWTIVQSSYTPTGTTAPNYSGSGPVLPYMCSTARLGSSGWTGQYYNQREDDGSGFVQLYLMLGATASVTFTPPAGRYFVEADIALWRCVEAWALYMQATGTVVTAGGAAVDLGVIDVNRDYMLKRRRYPKAFTVDGTTAITLTLGARKHYSDGKETGSLLFDNVRLVPADSVDGENLIANGSFSFTTDWTYINRTGLGSPYNPKALASAAGNVTAYGANWYDSGNNLLMIDNGLVYQDIPYMEAGRYRLSLAARKRVSWGNPTAKETDPVLFWLAKDGVTNVIAQVAPPVTNFTMYSWTFVLPESGAWRFGVEGLGEAGKDMNTLMDGFSLMRESLAADAPEMDEELVINVATGAKLRLDYPGTQTIGRLRLAGRPYSGFIRAADHPESLSGDGTLYVPPRGVTIIIK